MGRCSQLQSLQQEAELIFCLLPGYSQSSKYLLLEIFLVDTDTAATDLRTVQDQVVGLAAHAAGLCIKQFNIFLFRSGEGMMDCDMPFFIMVVLKQRKVDDPDKIIDVFINQPEPSGQFHP